MAWRPFITVLPFLPLVPASVPFDAYGDEVDSVALLQTSRSLLAPRDGRALPPLCFMKVHKTGGSTMANVLLRLAEENDMKPLRANNKGVIDWAKLRKEEEPAHKYDIIYNHQMFNARAVRAYLKPNPFIFSIIREPLSLIDSMFRWKATLNNRKYNVSTWAERIQLMASEPGNFVNPQARDLGWYDGVDLRRVDDIDPTTFADDHNFEKISLFIRNLDATLPLVMLTERYDEGLVMFKEQLNLPMESIKYLRSKVSDVAHIPPPTVEEERKVREFVNIDTAIYDHFSRRFHGEWGSHDWDNQVLELRNLNEGLERDCAKPRNVTRCPDIFLVEGFNDYNELIKGL